MKRDRLAILDAVGGFRPNCSCGLCRDFARTAFGIDPGALGGDRSVVFIAYPNGDVDIVDVRDLAKPAPVGSNALTEGGCFAEALCQDEGCPHYGTEHVCVCSKPGYINYGSKEPGTPINASGLMLRPEKSESQRRKDTPVWSGVLRYFPDAIAAVARLSKAGNDKHNPGEPLHWSRGKSNDHGDCLVRHQLTPDELDPETNELHAVAVAWRALAQLQILEEKRLSKGDYAVAEAPEEPKWVNASTPYGFGGCPIDGDAIVRVKLRDTGSYVTEPVRAGAMDWNPCEGGTIVAYQIVR